MCEICKRIEAIKSNNNPYFVRELTTGYVVIGDHQYFEGYTVFLYREHVTQLELLDSAKRLTFLNEMSQVAQAVRVAFKAEQMNYELLGNGDAHLHWHLFARHQSDLPSNSPAVWSFYENKVRRNPNSSGPVWWLNPEIMFEERNRPNEMKLSEMKEELNLALNQILN